MQVPTPKMSSDGLLALGGYHLASLRQTPETAGLAEGFQETQDDLLAAKRQREDAQNALIGPRVAVRFAEWGLEQALRGLALATHAVDNQSTSGPAFKSVFPNGLDAEIRPRGAAQLKACRQVKDRLATQPSAAELREEFGGKLESVSTQFEAKLEQRKKAGEALGLARAREDGARDTWVAAYDSLAGAIRTLFPRQRAHQDLYFDQFRSRNPRGDNENEGEDGDPPAQA